MVLTQPPDTLPAETTTTETTPVSVETTTTTSEPVWTPGYDELGSTWEGSMLLVGVLSMAALWAILGRLWASGSLGSD
jgi:hypothetical protein